MASLLFLLPVKGQLYLPHILQMLPMTSQHQPHHKKEEGTQLHWAFATSSLPRVSSLGPGGLSKNLGSLSSSPFPTCSWGLLRPSRGLTSLPETLPVSLPLSSGHHLAFPRRAGCGTGSRSVTSPFPDGTETSIHPPFIFKGLYDF